MLAAIGLIVVPTAAANDFQDVYAYYKKRGTIRPCQFSENKLRNAQRQTPPDVEQYAPSFLDALATARENASSCSGGGSTQTATTPAASPPAPTPSTPTAAPTPSTPQPVPAQPTPTAATPTPAPTVPTGVANAPSVATKPAAQDNSAPAAVWALALLAALAVLAGLAAAVAWWFGWSPERWSRPLGASFSDFGSRVDDAGREFGDWLRTGH